jgi:hypothetical protein
LPGADVDFRLCHDGHRDPCGWSPSWGEHVSTGRDIGRTAAPDYPYAPFEGELVAGQG